LKIASDLEPILFDNPCLLQGRPLARDPMGAGNTGHVSAPHGASAGRFYTFAEKVSYRMDVQIVSNADGSVKTVALDQLNVAEARIIRLSIDPATVKSVSIEGQDMVILLQNGETIRIQGYVKADGEKSADVVFVDGEGQNWLTSISDKTGQFGKVDWDDLIGSSLAAGSGNGGGAGGLLLPILGGIGAIGGIGAAAGGGGGSGGGSGGGGQGNVPPVFTARLEADTGKSNSDGITSNGKILVSGVQDGATWQYRTNGGEWKDGSGNSFTLPEGTHAGVEVRELLTGGTQGKLINLGTITVDTSVAAPTASLTDDTGISEDDGITNDGRLTVANVEAGASVEYQTSANGPWTAFPSIPYTLPEGIYSQVSVRVVDVAGNVSNSMLIGPITVDTSAPTLTQAGLVTDTGVSGNDGITSDGRVAITTNDPNARVFYRTTADGPWTEFTSMPYTLPEGVYPEVTVRVVDVAGNGAEKLIGPVTVDNVAPEFGNVALTTDTGSAADDLISADGSLTVEALLGAPLEAGAIVQYRSIADAEWISFDGSNYSLGEGEYRSLAIRVIDAAGNASEPIIMGDVIIDKSPPILTSARLAANTGVSADDGITDNPALVIETNDPTAFIQYQTSANGSWISLEVGDTNLPFGVYSDVSVRLMDKAGNISGEKNLGPLTILSPVRVELVEDTGISTTDGITMDGRVVVLDLPENATFRYRTDVDDDWTDGDGISFTLAEGTYDDVIVVVTYADGNVGAPIHIGPITVDMTKPTVSSSLEADTGPEGAVQPDGPQGPTEPAGFYIDGITANGLLNFATNEAGSTIQVRLSPTEPWVTLSGTSMVLTGGIYSSVQARSIDAAGNVSEFHDVPPFEIDNTGPTITARLTDDTGSSATDGITSNGRVDVTDLALGDTWRFRTSATESWQVGTDSHFILEAGSYANVQVQATDKAGNLGQLFSLGPITVTDSVGSIENITVALAEDSGAVGDGVTNNGTINVNGLSAGMTYVYRTVDSDGTESADISPIGPITVPDHSFLLPEGSYANVKVIISDGAGTALLTKTTGPIVVDMTPPPAPTATLLEDSGTPDDGISNNGTVKVTGIETGATWEYTLGDPVAGPWISGSGDSFVLGAGSYTNIYVRQTDVAGNVGQPSTLGNIQILPLEAVDDNATFDMGQISSTPYGEQINSDIQVLGLLEASGRSAGPATMSMARGGSASASGFGLDNSVSFTVSEDHFGEIIVGVKQTSLLAVADAFKLEIVDAWGNVVYSAVTQNSLVGDVAGLGLLGLTDDDRLTARIPDLPPGEYHVVVRNSPGALEQLLSGSSGGLSLENLGQGGAILGDHNQQVILDAVDQALGGRILGGVVSNSLGLVLKGMNLLPVTNLVKVLSDFLGGAGLLGLLDTVKDAVAHSLLSNTLTLLQKTTVYTQLTEYNFAGDAVNGNVISGDNGTGADRGGADAFVLSVSNADSEVFGVPQHGSVDIAGEYGTLTIYSDGRYSYQGNGAAGSLGALESFRYTLSNGRETDSASLNIRIAGQIVKVGADSIDGTVVWGVQADPKFFKDTDSLIGKLYSTGTTYSDTFTLGDNMSVQGKITLEATVAYNQGGLITVQKLVGGNWVTFHELEFDVRLARLGKLAELDLSTINMGAGTYRIKAELDQGAASFVYVKTEFGVTYDDREFVESASIIRGNYLANDDVGIGGGHSEFRNPETGDYVRVARGTFTEIEGEYGTLKVFADGSYSYEVSPDAPYFPAGVQEVFDYRLVNVNGQFADSTITINLQPSGAGVMRMAAFDMDDLLNDYLGGAPDELFGAPIGDAPDGVPLPDDDLSYLLSNPPLSPIDDLSQASYI
jgi:hypothetical protein